MNADQPRINGRLRPGFIAHKQAGRARGVEVEGEVVPRVDGGAVRCRMQSRAARDICHRRRRRSGGGSNGPKIPEH